MKQKDTVLLLIRAFCCSAAPTRDRMLGATEVQVICESEILPKEFSLKLEIK